MSVVTTTSMFRFNSLRAKFWAFGQMQYAHAHLSKIEGLSFYKLMGSGSEPVFGLMPDFGFYALLGVCEKEKSSEHFFYTSEIFARFKKHSSDQWTIYMRSIQTKGLWSRQNPFPVSAVLNKNNPLIVVITRATIKLNKLIAFWRFVPTSQRPLQKGFKGLIIKKV